MNWYIQNKKSILKGMLFFMLLSGALYAMDPKIVCKIRRTNSHEHVHSSPDESSYADQPYLLYDSDYTTLNVEYDDEDESSVPSVRLDWIDRHGVRYAQYGKLSESEEDLVNERDVSARTRRRSRAKIELLYNRDDNEFYFLPTSEVERISNDETDHDEQARQARDTEYDAAPPSQEDSSFDDAACQHSYGPEVQPALPPPPPSPPAVVDEPRIKTHVYPDKDGFDYVIEFELLSKEEPKKQEPRKPPYEASRPVFWGRTFDL